MKQVIPFEKEIIFKTKIAEITSISLEHEIIEKEDTLGGEFIVSGEYKSHELSLNKESFLYRLPFFVDFTEKVEKDSIEFSINDFQYEIMGKDVMKVKIEFMVKGDIIKEEEIISEEEVITANNFEEINEITLPDIDERNNEETILSYQEEENTYVTYKVHIVRNNETIDSICQHYKIEKDLLEPLNNIDNIMIGDKIIIPTMVNE